MLVTVFNKNTGLYEIMPQGDALAHVRQPDGLGITDLYRNATSFRTPLQATGEELAHDIGASFVLARNKTLKRLKEKAVEDRKHPVEITDYARGSIMIGHWKQVEALRKLTEPVDGGPAIDVAGSRLVWYVDNFAEPLGNGMRRMMQKYDVSNDNDERHVCEIQARVAEMKAAEDLTHKIYRMKRDFTRMALSLGGADPATAGKLAALAGHCHDLIKPIHDLEAMRHGYDVLITAPYDPATAPHPENPILQILMQDKKAAAQIVPILKMNGPTG